MFYYLSKTLRETVECFGNGGDDLYTHEVEHGPFYCGMNRIMTLPTFSIRLCGPVSTSMQKTIGVRFADDNGMVIRLNNNGDSVSSGALKFFNCSFMSSYKEEDERLFFGGMWMIRVETIIRVDTKQNFIHVFKPLFCFDSIINGSDMDGNKLLKTLNKNDIILLKHLVNYSLDKTFDIRYDKYIYQTWKTFTQHKKIIIINSYMLVNYKFPKEILSLLMYDLVESKEGKICGNTNIFQPLILSLFPNIEKIIFYTTSSGGGRVYPFLFSSFFSLFWGD
eukprot:452360_1